MSKSRDIADSAATINYIDNVTSDVQDQIDNLDPLPSQTGNAGNYLTTDGTTASWGEVSASPTLEAIASGSLANGDLVTINSDGTVSRIFDANAPSGPSSPVVFDSTAVSFTSTTFDSVSNKIIIVYSDVTNSKYGTAVVGTISGSSISFGTPVVYHSNNVEDGNSVQFDSNENKIVVAYTDRGNSQYGTAKVGTVSGTSISFGSPVVIQSTWNENHFQTFDSNSNKIVVGWRDRGAARGTAAVGTVSGTSISFGTPVQFVALDISVSNSATFDTVSNQVVFAFRVPGALRGVLGTVSGTSISFGSSIAVYGGTPSSYGVAVNFDTAENKIVFVFGIAGIGRTRTATVSGTSIVLGSTNTIPGNFPGPLSSAYDVNSGKHIIFYRDGSNSSKLSEITGTVSGSSVLFGAVTDMGSTGVCDWISAAYDTNANKSVVAFEDQGNSNYGTSILFVPSDSNLTSTGYIGISDAAYSDGATAKIQIVGSVDDSQSGLIAGQQYYVQFDGTLSTTPYDPSVFAGTAVSATKLIVKG